MSPGGGDHVGSTSPSEPGAAERRFPHVRGRDLQGRDVELPRDLAGHRNVAVIAFQREHQDLVDSWVPWLESRAAADPTFRFCEIPSISGRWSLARRFIDGGMAASIRVPEVLARTITYYGDLDRVTRPLRITDRGTIWLVVVDADGGVGAVERGAYDEETAARVAAALDAIPDGPGAGPDSAR